MAPDAPIPKPAASVVVLRPAPEGFEVLVVKRRGGGTFGDLVVFPGGTVDDDDRFAAGRAGFDDGAHRAAALRELAEETGLLASTRGVEPAPGLRGADLYRWLDAAGGFFDIGSLVLVSRWVTPSAMPYRFDTWFYLFATVDPPDVVLDEAELTGHAWVTPSEALERAAEGRWAMILPTLAHLRWLARRASVEDAAASARGADGRTLITPEVMGDGSMVPVHMPAEAT